MKLREGKHESGTTHRVSGGIYTPKAECPVSGNPTEGHDLAVTAQILQRISPQGTLKYICTVDYKTLGQNIRRLRVTQGFRQKDLRGLSPLIPVKKSHLSLPRPIVPCRSKVMPHISPYTRSSLRQNVPVSSLQPSSSQYFI